MFYITVQPDIYLTRHLNTRIQIKETCKDQSISCQQLY